MDSTLWYRTASSPISCGGKSSMLIPFFIGGGNTRTSTNRTNQHILFFRGVQSKCRPSLSRRHTSSLTHTARDRCCMLLNLQWPISYSLVCHKKETMPICPVRQPYPLWTTTLCSMGSALQYVWWLQVDTAPTGLLLASLICFRTRAER